MIFHAEGMSVAAGGKILAEGVEFSLPQGSILALTGPNGAGKSTLLRVLAGLELPRKGRFFLQKNGMLRDMHDMPLKERAKIVSYMEQSIAGDIPLTVKELVMLGRAPWQNVFGHNSTEDESACQNAMERAHVLPLAGRRWQDLSGGERQRALMARVLCQNTALMLLDEPTSALDYRHQQELMELLRRCCKEGRTVIMVTHDLNLASLYADSVLLLGGKRPVFGTPQEVFVPPVLEDVYGCTLLVDVHPCGKARVSLPGNRMV